MSMVDRVLENLEVVVEPFALCEIGEGSDLTIDELGWVTLHFVIAGEGQVVAGRNSVADLRKHSLCLVKRRHDLHGTAGAGASAGASSLEGVTHLFGSPSGDPDFVVACGRIQASYGRAIGLFDLIDDPIVLDFSKNEDMRHLFDMILRESANPSAGSLGMIAALMRQCLILVVRRLSRSSARGLMWVDALGDDRMSAVIKTVLDHPEAPHSVASLSEVAHMSRSAFAASFRDCFNQTPMSFVRTVRLHRCATLLRTTQLSTSAIARRCGFSSRSHFSSAFSKEYEMSPGQFRRMQSDDT